MKTFNVQCGDGTGGRLSADSQPRAKEMAQEMCNVHRGVQGEPAPRTEEQQ